MTAAMYFKKILKGLVRIIHAAERAPLLGSLLSRGLGAYASVPSKRYWQAKEERLRGRVEALAIARDKSSKGIFAAKHEKIRLGWVSSWNSRCGIAMYSKHLTDNLDKQDFDLKIFTSTRDERIKADEPNVIRCWGNMATDEVGDLVVKVLEEDIEALVVQFNFGFFKVNSLGMMIDILKGYGVKIFVTFHSTADVDMAAFKASLSWIKDSLKKADYLFVHSKLDLERLKGFGIADNVVLFSHGVLSRQTSDSAGMKRKMGLTGKMVISSYGFLLPHKGIKELIQAFHILAAKKTDLHLMLVNSLYPNKISDNLKKECQDMIRRLDVSKKVTMITDFLDDEESLSLLECSDLIVYPYLSTQESASGAVRFGLASKRPVACTSLPIFNDVKEAVSFLPGNGSEEIAEGIDHLLDSKGELDRKREMQERWVKMHSWDLLGRRYGRMIKSKCRIQRTYA